MWKKLTCLLIVIFMVFKKKIKSSYDFMDLINDVSNSMVISMIFSYVLVDKILWKNILLFFRDKKVMWPFIEQWETPILKSEYNCKIHHNYKGGGIKEAKIKISQTYTSIDVTVKTDEMESSTIISDIVKFNNKFVLYYLYRTNPKIKYIEENRPQLGGCKIILNSISEDNYNKKLSGKYWTTSETIGDIELY